MRPLTEPETQTLFRKLADYTGRSLNNLIAPESGERFVFRVQQNRVYYVRESLANLATSVPRDNLLSLGVCLGKFTKTGKFRLHITALDIVAPHARYKVWVKPNGEMPFLYGGNVVKAHVGRWSEDCPQHQGVIVLSMNDTPLVCICSIARDGAAANEMAGIRCHGTVHGGSPTRRADGRGHIPTSRHWRVPARGRHTVHHHVMAIAAHAGRSLHR